MKYKEKIPNQHLKTIKSTITRKTKHTLSDTTSKQENSKSKQTEDDSDNSDEIELNEAHYIANHNDSTPGPARLQVMKILF